MVFVTGDTHGNVLGEMKRFNSKKFSKKKSLTKQDVVIIAGDFGFLFNNPQTSEEQYWLEWLRDQPFTTAFIDGNHDNFDLLNHLPTNRKWGGTVGVVNDSIFHLLRGYVYTIEGETFFCFGGARSIDKHLRTEGVSYWIDEEPGYWDYVKALIVFEEHRNAFDYIITHDAPSCIRNQLISHHCGEEKYQLIDFLDMMVQDLSFRHWYFGHHHIDRTIEDKFTCCYNRIHEIGGKDNGKQ
jgi:hypothetical protein